MNSTKSSRLAQALDSLWRACSAAQTLIILVCLLAGTVATAAIIPQQPDGVSNTAADSWLTATAASYRSAGPFLRGTGMFDLLGGLWMRALLAALAFNLALRVARQAQSLRSGPHCAPPAGLPVHRDTFPGPLSTRQSEAQKKLRQRFSTVICASDDSHAQFFAERRRAGAFGPLLTYLAALIILIGLVLNDGLGWRVRDISLAPGGAAILTQAGGLRAAVTAIRGEGVNGQSDVTLTRDGESLSFTLGPTRPIRKDDLWLAQQSVGPALIATAQGSDGRPLLLQSLAPGARVNQTLHLLFGQTQGEQAFAIPTRNQTFRAVSYPALPERGINHPVFLVEIYRGTEAAPAISEVVEDRAALTLDNVTLVLQRDHYVSLEVAYLPGLSLIIAGILITLLGVALTAYFGPARAWIGMAADRENVPVAVRAATSAEGDREVTQLLALLHPAVPKESGDAG